MVLSSVAHLNNEDGAPHLTGKPRECLFARIRDMNRFSFKKARFQIDSTPAYRPKFWVLGRLRSIKLKPASKAVICSVLSPEHLFSCLQLYRSQATH